MRLRPRRFVHDSGRALAEYGLRAPAEMATATGGRAAGSSSPPMMVPLDPQMTDVRRPWPRARASGRDSGFPPR
jgi:hypothetical protein